MELARCREGCLITDVAGRCCVACLSPGVFVMMFDHGGGWKVLIAMWLGSVAQGVIGVVCWHGFFVVSYHFCG